MGGVEAASMVTAANPLEVTYRVECREGPSAGWGRGRDEWFEHKRVAGLPDPFVVPNNSMCAIGLPIQVHRHFLAEGQEQYDALSYDNHTASHTRQQHNSVASIEEFAFEICPCADKRPETVYSR